MEKSISIKLIVAGVSHVESYSTLSVAQREVALCHVILGTKDLPYAKHQHAVSNARLSALIDVLV